MCQRRRRSASRNPRVHRLDRQHLSPVLSKALTNCAFGPAEVLDTGQEMRRARRPTAFAIKQGMHSLLIDRANSSEVRLSSNKKVMVLRSLAHALFIHANSSLGRGTTPHRRPRVYHFESCLKRPRDGPAMSKRADETAFAEISMRERGFRAVVISRSLLMPNQRKRGSLHADWHSGCRFKGRITAGVLFRFEIPCRTS